MKKKILLTLIAVMMLLCGVLVGCSVDYDEPVTVNLNVTNPPSELEVSSTRGTITNVSSGKYTLALDKMCAVDVIFRAPSKESEILKLTARDLKKGKLDYTVDMEDRHYNVVLNMNASVKETDLEYVEDDVYDVSIEPNSNGGYGLRIGFKSPDKAKFAIKKQGYRVRNFDMTGEDFSSYTVNLGDVVLLGETQYQVICYDYDYVFNSTEPIFSIDFNIYGSNYSQYGEDAEYYIYNDISGVTFNGIALDSIPQDNGVIDLRPIQENSINIQVEFKDHIDAVMQNGEVIPHVLGQNNNYIFFPTITGGDVEVHFNELIFNNLRNALFPISLDDAKDKIIEFEDVKKYFETEGEIKYALRMFGQKPIKDLEVTVDENINESIGQTIVNISKDGYVSVPYNVVNNKGWYYIPYAEVLSVFPQNLTKFADKDKTTFNVMSSDFGVYIEENFTDKFGEKLMYKDDYYDEAIPAVVRYGINHLTGQFNVEGEFPTTVNGVYKYTFDYENKVNSLEEIEDKLVQNEQGVWTFTSKADYQIVVGLNFVGNPLPPDTHFDSSDYNSRLLNDGVNGYLLYIDEKDADIIDGKKSYYFTFTAYHYDQATHQSSQYYIEISINEEQLDAMTDSNIIDVNVDMEIF